MSYETRSYKSEKARFATTQWSMVLRAARSDEASRMEAMETICRTYWYPIYAFIRRKGVAPTEAQDCAQDFFQLLISGSILQGVSAEKGRFRSYLLACCQHFLLNMWERERAQKRGGGSHHVSIDDAAESRFLQTAATKSAEDNFDREWASELFQRVELALADEYRSRDKAELWETLRPYLHESKDIPVAALAAKLAVTENHLPVLLHRLKARYRELLRSAVTATLDDPAELKDEIRYLLRQLE